MRTSKDDFDLRIGFSFLDSPAIRLIGRDAFLVYLKLRRYVWRSTTTDLGVEYKAGRLVAYISQARIAEELALSRKHINEMVRSLEQHGWLFKSKILRESFGRKPFPELIYILGERVELRGGSHGEVFFADALMEQFAILMESKAGEDGKLPMEEQFEMLKAIFKPLPVGSDDDPKGGGGTPGDDDGSPEGGEPGPTSESTRVATEEHHGDDHSHPGLQQHVPTLTTDVTSGPTEVEKSRSTEKTSNTEDFNLTPPGGGACGGDGSGETENKKNDEVTTVCKKGNSADVNDAYKIDNVSEDDNCASPLDTLRQAELASLARTNLISEQAARIKKDRAARMEKSLADTSSPDKPQKRRQRAPGGPRNDEEVQRVANLWVDYEEAFQKAFPGSLTPKWGDGELAQLKRLVERFDKEVAGKALGYVCAEWEDVSQRYGLGGYPTVGLLSSVHPGTSIVMEAQTGRKFIPKTKEEKRAEFELRRQQTGEYDAEAAKRSPSIGWGDDP